MFRVWGVRVSGYSKPFRLKNNHPEMTLQRALVKPLSKPIRKFDLDDLGLKVLGLGF